jgi:hypothetical protein
MGDTSLRTVLQIGLFPKKIEWVLFQSMARQTGNFPRNFQSAV